MALINKDGNYIRINKEAIKQALSSVRYHTYKDKATRMAPTEFDLAPEQVEILPVSDDTVNGIVTGLYDELKRTSEFEGCKDA